MGCGASKEDARVRDKYAPHLQDPRVVAAMETLHIDRRDAGLRFYRLFAAIDADESDSIALDELLKYLGLDRSPFAEQVFSNLGRQRVERDLRFDDFMLNMWSFCTMSRNDLIVHVFHIYDDDGNGVLDTAEVDSLLRFIYQTETLSTKVTAMLDAADADHDRLISKDEFLSLCTTNRDLLAPVYALQSRAQEKCFGKLFWSKEAKKRPVVLGSMDDVFAVFDKTLSGSKTAGKLLSAISTTQEQQLVTEAAKAAELHPTASERLAQRQHAQELQALDDWIERQRQDPVVDDYLVVSCQKALEDERLEEQKRSRSTTPEAVEVLTKLRHSTAVSAKKLAAAHTALEIKWGEEEHAAIERRHAAIRSMVKGISARTLLQQTGKSGAGAVVGDYLQKKLDSAEGDVKQEFRGRWERLERAASHLSKRQSEERAAENSTTVKKKVFVSEKRDSIASKPVPSEYTKVVPIADEVWAECFDADSQRVYYVSSLGNSSWDPPPSFHRQW